jgi:hypothetical protein
MNCTIIILESALRISMLPYMLLVLAAPSIQREVFHLCFLTLGGNVTCYESDYYFTWADTAFKFTYNPHPLVLCWLALSSITGRRLVCRWDDLNLNITSDLDDGDRYGP